MPALEIMPHCSTMEEAQRRAREASMSSSSRRRGTRNYSGDDATSLNLRPSKNKNKNALPRRQSAPSPPGHNDNDGKPKESLSLRPIQMVTRLFGTGPKTSIARLRRQSFPGTTNKVEDAPGGTKGAGDNHSGGATATRSENVDGSKKKFLSAEKNESSSLDSDSFRSISVKYYPRIMEDEEEEPPEAFVAPTLHKH